MESIFEKTQKGDLKVIKKNEEVFSYEMLLKQKERFETELIKINKYIEQAEKLGLNIKTIQPK